MSRNLFFSLCLVGALGVACATRARSTPEPETADTGSVDPCTPPTDGGIADATVELISHNGNVHFSTDTVTVAAGGTVALVSQVNQDRCISVTGLVLDAGTNPQLVKACKAVTWTLDVNDRSGPYELWSCAMSDCTRCTKSQGIKNTINGTLDVTGRVDD